jgi:hypothetical protein
MISATLTDALLSLDQVISEILDLVPDLRHVELESSCLHIALNLASPLVKNISVTYIRLDGNA